jgi:hypothetical protein
MEMVSNILKKQDFILLSLLKISLLLVFLYSMFAWFLWEPGPATIGSISIVYCVLYLITRPSFFPLKKGSLMVILLLILVRFYCVRGTNINGYIEELLTTLPIVFVILLKDTLKIDLLRFITSAMALILFVSLCAWILFLAGVQFPYSVVNFNDGQYWYNNYYLFLYDLNPYFTIPRFSAIFLEPGHLGMITSLLLYANRFEIRRKEVLVLLVSTIFTFSLAAYILLIISVTVFLLLRSKKPAFYMTLWIVLLITGYYFFANHNNGNNIVNNLIIERLQFDNRNLSGDNRFSESMDSYFVDFQKGGNLYTGIGLIKYESLNLGANAGYKVFLIRNGVIGTSLLFLFYLSLVLYNKSKEAAFLLLIYILSFAQRAYALWDCELLIFITAMALFKNQRKQEIIWP